MIEITIYFSSLHIWDKVFWLIVALLAIGLASWGIRRVRDWTWKWGRFERSDDLLKRNNLVKRGLAAFAQWCYENWGTVIIGGAISLFVFLVFVITQVFGDRNLVSAMALGTAILVFMLFQLPKLLSPHVQIVPMQTTYTKLTNLNRPKDIKNQETYVDGQKKRVTAREIPMLKVNEYCERFLFISNTGINNFENWSVHLIFDPDIEVDEGWLDRYKNSPHIQYATQKTEEKGTTIIYSPRSGFSLGPNSDLIIGFKVKALRNGNVKPLRLEINSSNRWGDTVKYFSWVIKE